MVQRYSLGSNVLFTLLEKVVEIVYMLRVKDNILHLSY